MWYRSTEIVHRKQLDHKMCWENKKLKKITKKSEISVDNRLAL